MNHFIFPSPTYKRFNFSTSLPTVIFIFKVVANLVGVKWYLIVILLYISLIISDVEHLFMSYCSSECLLWRKVYLGLLPIFWGFSFINWAARAASHVALVVKNLPANAGDVRDVEMILGSGRSPGEGNGSLFQYFCLGNPMDRETWQAMVHRVAKSQTWLKWLSIAHQH